MTPTQIMGINMLLDTVIRGVVRKVQAISEMTDEQVKELIQKEEDRTDGLLRQLRE